MATRQERLESLIAPIAKALDCELWGVEYLSQGRFTTLRIFIEKDEGIDVDDCERISRQVSSVLDVEDPIPGEYTLEVSSPGMDRQLFTLEHYRRYIGEQIAVKLNRPFEGRRKLKGLLSAVESDEVVVQVDDEEYLLPIELIEKANVVPQF